VPGYGYADRLSIPVFRFSATPQKLLPWPFFPDVLRPGFRTVRCSSVEIASSGSFGGRSTLLIFVRVALQLPSDDKTVPAFTFPAFGKLPVAEASVPSFRRRAQPSNEHLAVAGVCRSPSVLPSGFRLRLFLQSGFHPSDPTGVPIKFRRLLPAFRAASYRSPDVSKINRKTFLCNFLNHFFHGSNAPDMNTGY